MEITLQVDTSFHRKLKALQTLTGHSADQIESTLGSILEQAVTEKIMDVLGIESAPAPIIGRPVATPKSKKVSAIPMDENVAFLGDEDPSFDDPQFESQEVEGLTEPEAFVSNEGVTDEDLDHDMDLDDPETEGAGAAGMLGSGLKYNDGVDANELFAKAAFGEEDAWAAKRRKTVKLRGKVTMGVDG